MIISVLFPCAAFIALLADLRARMVPRLRWLIIDLLGRVAFVLSVL